MRLFIFFRCFARPAVILSFEKQCGAHGTRNIIKPVIQRFHGYVQTQHRAATNCWQFLCCPWSDQLQLHSSCIANIFFVKSFICFIEGQMQFIHWIIEAIYFLPFRSFLISSSPHAVQVQHPKMLIPHKKIKHRGGKIK